MPANRTLALLRALTVTSALGLAVVPRFAAAQTAAAPDTTTTTTTTTTTAPAPATVAASDQEEPTVLSPFVVDASEDKGSYKANSTLAGTRVRTDLNDIASSISVVTAQFLQDTNATNNESLLVYTLNTQVGGLQGNFAGNVAGGTLFQESLVSPNTNTRVRGLTSADNTRNYFLTDIPWDAFNVNRVDLQRGPNSILFGVGSPGGIINVSTNDASFVNSNVVTNRIGSYGSLRDTADLNYVLIKNELAIRVGWVNDNELYQQEPAYCLTTRYYGALRFDPVIFGKDNHTSLRANIEKGEITSNNPRQLPPDDAITPWFEDGKPTNNEWATTMPNGGPFVGRDGGSGYEAAQFGMVGNGVGNRQGRSYWPDVLSYFNGSNSGSTPTTQSSTPTYVETAQINQGFSLNGNGSIGGLPAFTPQGVPTYNTYAQYAANPAISAAGAYYADKVLTDSSVFNFYDHLLDGVNKKEWQNWTAYDISLSQTFFNDRLGFELVYDQQHHTQGENQDLSGQNYAINVDVEQTYTDGTPNPDVGRPYVATGSDAYSDDSQTIDRSSLRFTTTYELRFDDFFDKNSLLTKILGRSVFTGLIDEDQRKEQDLSWEEYATTAQYAYDTNVIPASERTNRQFEWLDYIGPNLLGQSSAHGANLSNISIPISPGGSTSVINFNSHWNAPNVNPAAPYSWISYSTGQVFTGTQKDNPANYVGFQTLPVTWLDAGNPADFPQLIVGNQKQHYTDINQGITWQGYLFEGDLVPTLGYRKDDVVNYATAAASNSTTGITALDVNQDPTSRRQLDGISKAWGGVFHIPKTLTSWMPWGTTLSVFYDHDENFKADAPRYNLFGDTVANPLGKTKEYGFTISSLNDKLSLKVDWYNTQVSNVTFDVTSGNSIAGTGGNGYYMWAAPAWGYFWAAQLQDYLEGKTPANSGTANYALGDSVPNSGGGPGTPGFDNAPETIGTPGFNGPAGTAGSYYSGQAIVNAWLNIPVPNNFFNYYGIHPVTINPAAASASGQLASAFGPGFNDSTSAGFSPGNEQPGPINAVSTETETSKGTELELTAQPMRNWNITLNYSTTNAIKTAIDPATVGFMAALNSFFNGPGGQVREWYNGGGRLGPDWQRNVYAPYLTEVAEEGQSAPDLPHWNFNLVTTYNFDRGPLKGVLVGGGFRDEGSRVLGYQFNQALNSGSGGLDVSKPWRGPTDKHLDLWFGYQHRVFANKVNWRIQANLTNVFENAHLVPAQYEPDGSLALARIEDGMQWSLTNSFEF
jgi:outer membrane receptor protein involved in Fe transport